MALLLCVLAAVVYGAASILQAVGARRAARSSWGAAGMIREWQYVVGLLLDLVAWLMSLVALRTLPLFAVEAVLAGSVAVTVVMAGVLLHTRLRHLDIAAVAVVVAALVVIAASAGAEGSREMSVVTQVGLLAAAPLLALGGWIAHRRYGSVVAGGVAGLAFGGVAMCARAAHATSLADVLGTPLAWGVIVFGLLGIVLYGQALKTGNVGAVTAAMWVAQVVVPAIVGVALLGDHVRHGWTVPAVRGVVAATAATIVLARSPAQAPSV